MESDLDEMIGEYETIIAEKSLDAEFNVIVTSFDISPLTVKSFPEFKLKLDPDLTLRYPATSDEVIVTSCLI